MICGGERGKGSVEVQADYSNGEEDIDCIRQELFGKR